MDVGRDLRSGEKQQQRSSSNPPVFGTTENSIDQEESKFVINIKREQEKGK
jgi:hypothetical protein